MKELELVQTFEDTFIEAGKLAMELRDKAEASNKFNSGASEVDIVTTSDLAVQDFILNKLAKSPLNQLELVAEENTPSIHLFADHADLVLTLDPIDGTSNYASGKKMYSVIVSIHDKTRPLYTFDYWPEIDWGIKIVNDKYKFIGTSPNFGIDQLPRAIVYNAFNQFDPRKDLPELYNKLTAAGYEFIEKKQISNDVGGTALLLSGLTDGYCASNIAPVDCMVALHYGLAKGYKIYRDLDLSHLSPSKHAGGIGHYEGYYVVAR